MPSLQNPRNPEGWRPPPPPPRREASAPPYPSAPSPPASDEDDGVEVSVVSPRGAVPDAFGAPTAPILAARTLESDSDSSGPRPGGETPRRTSTSSLGGDPFAPSASRDAAVATRVGTSLLQVIAGVCSSTPRKFETSRGEVRRGHSVEMSRGTAAVAT